MFALHSRTLRHSNLFYISNAIKPFCTSFHSSVDYRDLVHGMLESLSDRLLEIEDHKELKGFDVQYIVSGNTIHNDSFLSIK